MRMCKAPLDKLLCLLALVMSLSFQSLALSEEEVNRNDFVVESSVFRRDEKKPLQQTRTVFHGARVYDRLAESKSIAVFDLDDRIVYMGDENRKVRTAITFQHLLRCQEVLSREATKYGKFSAFLANPKFVVEFRPPRSITLSSPWMTYAATGHQSAADVVERYLDFADWTARLANVVNGSPYPAQARIKLNDELRKKNWQVTQVTRTAGPREPDLPKLKCETKYRMELRPSDQDFIREAENALKNFRAVEFSTYVSGEKSQRVASK